MESSFLLFSPSEQVEIFRGILEQTGMKTQAEDIGQLVGCLQSIQTNLAAAMEEVRYLMEQIQPVEEPDMKARLGRMQEEMLESLHRAGTQVQCQYCDHGDLERVETVLNFAEIKAIAPGNPLIMEKVQVDSEVTRLRVLKSAYEGKRYVLQDTLLRYPKWIEEKERELEKILADIQTRVLEMMKTLSFEITFQDMRLTGHKEAGEVLRSIMENKKTSSGMEEEIGNYKGFRILFNESRLNPKLHIIGSNTYELALQNSDIGNMVRLENLINGLDQSAQKCRE